jgi:hypothetical protein
MKKLFLSLFVAAITTGAAFAQQTINDPNAEKRTVSSFHGIDVGTGIELLLTEGTIEEVAVSATKIENRDKIVTEVVKGILKIHYDNKLGSVNKPKESKNLKAYVSYKSLDLLDVTTGAEVKITGVLKSSTLDMNANTGALINGEVNITTLKIDQNTGSKITLTGKAEKLDIDGSTGSKFMGENMSTVNCNVKVNTGAKVTVNAEKELEVKASTGGIVNYKGNATIREIKTNTGGSVSKI